MRNPRLINAVAMSIILFMFLQLITCTSDNLPPPTVQEELTTTINWTAFKYTNRKGLNGHFDEVDIDYSYSKNTVELLKTVEFDITTNSLNTGLDFRDFNIKEYFFKHIASDFTIKGKVIAVEGDTHSGNCRIELNLNGVTKEVMATYTLIGSSIKLEGTFDLAEWGFSDALNFLNNKVIEYHTGSDGKNKLWSDVAFQVQQVLDSRKY